MDSVLVGIIGEANGCKLLARADKQTALYIFELAFWHDRIPGTHWFLGSLLVSNQHRMNWWYQTSFGPYKLWCALRPMGKMLNEKPMGKMLNEKLKLAIFIIQGLYLSLIGQLKIKT